MQAHGLSGELVDVVLVQLGGVFPDIFLVVAEAVNNIRLDAAVLAVHLDAPVAAFGNPGTHKHFGFGMVIRVIANHISLFRKRGQNGYRKADCQDQCKQFLHRDNLLEWFHISYVCTKGENMVAAKRGCCLFFAFTFRFPSAYSGFGTGRASSGVYQE